MGRRRVVRFLFVVALLLGLSNLPSLCAQTNSAKTASQAQEKYPPGLAREIHHQLLVLPFYSVFDNIEFTLTGGNVTLRGQVLRLTLKTNAEAAVRSIEGVTVVVNQIEILPAIPADDELRRSIYRAVFEDAMLSRYAVQTVPPIHIIVKNGNVTLEGSVESTSDKNLASARAGTAAGVHSVKNNLLVLAKGSAGE